MDFARRGLILAGDSCPREVEHCQILTRPLWNSPPPILSRPQIHSIIKALLARFSEAGELSMALFSHSDNKGELAELFNPALRLTFDNLCKPCNSTV